MPCQGRIAHALRCIFRPIGLAPPCLDGCADACVAFCSLVWGLTPAGPLWAAVQLDVRLKGLEAAAGAPADLRAPALPAPYSLHGDALHAELRALQREVRERWLSSLGQ